MLYIDLYDVCLIIPMDTTRNMEKWTERLRHLLSSILDYHKLQFYDIAHLHFLFFYFFVAVDVLFKGGVEFISNSY